MSPQRQPPIGATVMFGPYGPSRPAEPVQQAAASPSPTGHASRYTQGGRSFTPDLRKRAVSANHSRRSHPKSMLVA
ncbi:hypothetical protein STXM2123_2575 [Streptomyces sp. F-3]|nr:hypothetical protein STXM2123_2575 [Streptomyces sp. F-3]